MKIKDNVDIVQLCNYGFEKYGGDEKYYYYHFYTKTIRSFFGKLREIYISAKSKEIRVFEYDCILGRNEIKVRRRWIKDLIQADLVEKVGDKNG